MSGEFKYEAALREFTPELAKRRKAGVKYIMYFLNLRREPRFSKKVFQSRLVHPFTAPRVFEFPTKKDADTAAQIMSQEYGRKVVFLPKRRKVGKS